LNLVIACTGSPPGPPLKDRIGGYFRKKKIPVEIREAQTADELVRQDLSGADVLFLDPDLPGADGFRGAEEIRRRFPDLRMVLVTDDVEYVLKGYEIEVLRALHRTISEQELGGCLDAVFSGMGQKRRCSETTRKEKEKKE